MPCLLAAVFGCSGTVPSTGALDLKVEYSLDGSNRTHPEQLHEAPFAPYSEAGSNFGFTKDTLWLRVLITPLEDANASEPYLLEIAYPPLDRVELFEPLPDGSYRARPTTGDRLNFDTREVAHRSFVFETRPGPRPYYLRIRSESALIVPVSLKSRDTFLHENRVEQLWLGMFYGALIVMLLYNGFVYLMLRDSSYLFYIANLFGAVVYFLVWNGLAFELLWPNLPDWNNQANPFFQGFATAFLFLFVRSFLREELPAWVDRFFLALLVPCAAMMGLALLDYYGAAVQLGSLINVIGLAVGLPTGLYLLYRGYRPVRFLMLAWFFLLIGMLLNTLRTYAILPANFFTQIYSIQLGSAIEMVLFSLALADRFRLLEREKEEAHQSSAAKSAFLANMSHEIRTPLHAILGMAEVLEAESKDERARGHLSVLKGAGENLLHIVNDVLDISRIESGKLKIERVEFSLETLLDETIDLILSETRTKELDVTLFHDPSLADLVRGDPVRLRQVLLNLLTNAIKFTNQGEIYLEVRGDGDNVRFTVRDTGIGISQEKWEEIFEAFTQADESTTRHFGGTGLGLTICRRLVDLMGGRIGVDSTPGKGSRFYFTIPLPPSGRARQTAPELTGQRALLVINPGTTRLILREYLHATGIQIRECTPEDVRRPPAESTQGGPETISGGFQFIFLSERPLGGEPAEILEILRVKNTQARIVLLSSTAEFPGTGDPAQLPLPIRRATLFDLLSDTGGKRSKSKRQRRAPGDLPPGPVNRPLRILLAEDNEDNRLLFLAFLKKTPHQIEIAEDGRAAFELFQTKSFDLIFMDLQMPVMDGLTATRRIRAHEAEEIKTNQSSHRTPIYALTANVLSSEVTKSLDAGCDDHVGKPVSRARLLEIISRHTTK